MKALAAGLRRDGKSIGLVPTMGYFHEGHTSLMRRSASENDATIVTLFVNPTQFSPCEDLAKYPRDLERDTAMAEEAGANILFTPDNASMYPDGYKTFVTVEGWSSRLCGISRPIHFRGVTTVCAKLFNICAPDRAYFGMKDAQQLLIIKKMVKDLNMNLEIVPMPTVRESDGLAMSSRNVYLDPEQRKAATLINAGLMEAKKLIEAGETRTEKALEAARAKLAESPLLKIDYIEAVSEDTLEPARAVRRGTLIAVAAYLGATRLIDNLSI
jgi:pantoate--beta-alanine ligase